MYDNGFMTYETKPKTEPTPALTNISELFKKTEYKEKLTSMRELVKVADALDRPIIILGYQEDTMPDNYGGGDKACFRMDFKFADDPAEIRHFIRTEAKYLWDYLKAVNEVSPDLLGSGTVVAIICKGEKKNGKNRTPFYYFAGTMEP